jgi:hypothetical protein
MFKSHFIAILVGVDPSFPMSLWDWLIPQVVMTLNLLRQSKKTLSISAYQHVNGNFDYNKMLLAPLGCAVEMHESTNRRKTWDPHSLNGWYLGTLIEHYRCHKIFCKKTRSKRISDTVFFQHQYITQPTITTDDQIIKAIGDLASALWQQSNLWGKEEMAVLQKMNNILNNATAEPMEKNRKKKTVIFQDPIPEPRVGQRAGNMQQSPKTLLPPRLFTNKPTIGKAVFDKPLRTVPSSGPTTHSKYAQALAYVVSRGRSTQCQPPLNMPELAQAIIDDNRTAEFANEVFDTESKKLLKYQKLITHPKYHEV